MVGPSLWGLDQGIERLNDVVHARRVHTQYSCSLPADPLAVLSHHLSEGYAQVFLGRCFALANGEMVVSRSSADLEPIEQLS
jgi:hypothetical protein